MNTFRYERASDTASALSLCTGTSQTRYLGGGTNLVDLMRENIERPEALVDVTGLSQEIEEREDGGIIMAAGAKNTAVASHPGVRKNFPVLAQAILSGASAQIRNMATIGGNLMQRTRCYYFYDDAARCNKREQGAGCDAIDGFNRIHAILGASPSCIATHPSDMCVALAALDAIVHVEGNDGARKTIKLVDFHRLPGGQPEIETELKAGELITAVEIPALAFAKHSTYRKVRDRASYAFALVSVAAAIDLDGEDVCDVRLALGGVAHKPWRAFAAEDLLKGKTASEENFRAAAEVELKDAVGLRDNAFKIELAKRTICAVLGGLTAGKS